MVRAHGCIWPLLICPLSGISVHFGCDSTLKWQCACSALHLLLMWTNYDIIMWINKLGLYIAVTGLCKHCVLYCKIASGQWACIIQETSTIRQMLHPEKCDSEWPCNSPLLLSALRARDPYFTINIRIMEPSWYTKK